jgi:hypothetical protein
MYSMIGSYVCTNCKMKIEPFVYHKMIGEDHILFRKNYAEQLEQAVNKLNEENYKLWRAKEIN